MSCLVMDVANEVFPPFITQNSTTRVIFKVCVIEEIKWNRISELEMNVEFKCCAFCRKNMNCLNAIMT